MEHKVQNRLINGKTEIEYAYLRADNFIISKAVHPKLSV